MGLPVFVCVRSYERNRAAGIVSEYCVGTWGPRLFVSYNIKNRQEYVSKYSPTSRIYYYVGGADGVMLEILNFQFFLIFFFSSLCIIFISNHFCSKIHNCRYRISSNFVTYLFFKTMLLSTVKGDEIFYIF